MNGTLYLRVAKDGKGLKFAISTKPMSKAIEKNPGWRPTYLPTVLVKVDVDIPDKLFSPALETLKLKISDYEAQIAAEISKPGDVQE